MTNYAITVWTSGQKRNMGLALAALETYLETVTDSKTIHMVDVKVNNATYEAIVIHNA